MMVRTQIMLEADAHREAKRQAARHGISLAEYLRRLVAQDLGGSKGGSDPSQLFDLGESGGTDIASNKDDYLQDAVSALHSKH